MSKLTDSLKLISREDQYAPCLETPREKFVFGAEFHYHAYELKYRDRFNSPELLLDKAKKQFAQDIFGEFVEDLLDIKESMYSMNRYEAVDKVYSLIDKLLSA